MTMFGSPWFGAEEAAYTVDNSCRFYSGDSAYLYRTPDDHGNRQTWTLSFWMKLGKIGGSRSVINTGLSGAYEVLELRTNKFLMRFNNVDRSNAATNVNTNDWAHFVWRVNTPGDSGDRNRLYVNGTEVSYTGTDASLNASSTAWNTSSYANDIGTNRTTTFDGYLAEMIFLDGTSVGPGEFAETVDSVWVPKEFSGSYGTNGFYLDFADSADLGADQSGNSNDFTSSGLASGDQMKDSPTNNFSVFNPTASPTPPIASWTQVNLGLNGGFSASVYAGMSALVIPTDKKIYYEITCPGATGGYWGWGASTYGATPGSSNVGGDESVQVYNVSKFVNGSETGSYITLLAAGEIGMCAIDGATRKVWFGREGTWVGDPAAGSDEAGIIDNASAKDLHVAVTASAETIANFGADSSFAGNETRQNNADENGFGDFYYAPPSGFLALCTKNGATL